MNNNNSNNKQLNLLLLILVYKVVSKDLQQHKDRIVMQIQIWIIMEEEAKISI